MHKLNNALYLPCGVSLKNRIVKSPMSDSLGDGEGNPTEAQARLYERWAQGGAALSLIGEVQTNPYYPEKPGNLVLHPQSDKPAFQALTSRAIINDAHLWAQLGHAGALSYPPLSAPKGPSSLDIEDLKCAALTLKEVQALPNTFAQAATQAKNLGFSGVQIHAGHGFLLSQFLSPLFNQRKDEYGGAIKQRARILLEIISEVRHAVGNAFPVGVRINSSDMLEGGLTEKDALELVHFLKNTTLDLIDISGGTYFPGAKSSSDNQSKGPYFLEFARRAKELTKIPILITGGFKKFDEAIDAIQSGFVDAIGLARAMVLNPQLPQSWLNGIEENPAFPRFEKIVPGGITAWYTMRLTALAQDQEQTFNLNLLDALCKYDDRDVKRCSQWKKKFF